MKQARWLLALTLVNLALLVVLLAPRLAPAFADSGAPVLRGRALELVDDQGRIRASIQVLPAGRSAAGEAYPETVLLRLITERGRPSVKLAASEKSAGLSFAGPTGTSDTYVILEAGEKTTSLKLRNEDGRQQVLQP